MSVRQLRFVPGDEPSPGSLDWGFLPLRWHVPIAIRRASSWLLRDRGSRRVATAFSRKGGGLFAVAALSFAAGHLLPELPAFDTPPIYPPERCLRVVEVVRLALVPNEDPGPILLMQTAWSSSGHPLNSRPGTEDPCWASETTLPVPPIKNVVFRRQGGVLVPSVQPGDRHAPFFHISSGTHEPLEGRSSLQTAPEAT